MTHFREVLRYFHISPNLKELIMMKWFKLIFEKSTLWDIKDKFEYCFALSSL